MHHFNHERLDCYQVAREVVEWLNNEKFPVGRSNLKEQTLRASESLLLNIAEGASRVGQSRAHHFRIALGSAAEFCACLDLLPFQNKVEQQNKLRRIGAMLSKL
ncbi:four helix bundle protein [Lujinxingia litoralis]|nr:four helix bundle protein [Lujinxingia litoralis]